VATVQAMGGFKDGVFSGDSQLFWRRAKVGDVLKLEVPIKAAGRFRVRAAFCRAPDYGIIRARFGGREMDQGEVDLFVNFISFQEMEPDVVANYLHHVDRLQSRWVFLRNMREGKQIQKDGHVGVKTPIRSDDYVQMLPNYQLVARNVHPFGYETVDGFHSELQLFKRM
jgi:hypothetical protein